MYTPVKPYNSLRASDILFTAVIYWVHCQVPLAGFQAAFSQPVHKLRGKKKEKQKGCYSPQNPWNPSKRGGKIGRKNPQQTHHQKAATTIGAQMSGGCGRRSDRHPAASCNINVRRQLPKSGALPSCRLWELAGVVIDGHFSSVRVISQSLSLQAERLAIVGSGRDSGRVVSIMGSLGDGRAGAVLHSNRVMAEKHDPGGPWLLLESSGDGDALYLIRYCLSLTKEPTYHGRGWELLPFWAGKRHMRFTSSDRGKILYGNTRRICEKCVIHFFGTKRAQTYLLLPLGERRLMREAFELKENQHEFIAKG